MTAGAVAPIVIKLVGRGDAGAARDRWMRHLPGGRTMVGRCLYTFDPDDDAYDFLVVNDDLPPVGAERRSLRIERLACAQEHTMLLTTEPSSIKVYGPRFVRQFGHVLTSQEDFALRHPGKIQMQPALRWFYGEGRDRLRTWDEIAANPPLEKPRIISAIWSAKGQRHTMHGHRRAFLERIGAQMPEIAFYGRGAEPLDDKADALDDFRYHIAVENHIAEHHWTEKLADAFLGCALPFYCGAPNAAEYFPPESFIPIDIRDPDACVRTMRDAIETGEHEQRLPAILEARRRVLEDYNAMTLLPRLVEERFDADAPRGCELRSRYAMRRASPAASLLEGLEKARRRVLRPGTPPRLSSRSRGNN